MTIQFRRTRTNPDGTTEVYEPVMRHGMFVMADRAVHEKHNNKLNQFFVADAEAVKARLASGGGVSLRMKGQVTGQQNLITASEVEVLI
ncbi:hypothetical protein [Brevundimonas goettingensis]|uniref:Uncharacterized protein n=1 Tax=Brevundimonas goettingensis TaxID=2774190 RepID=A0A975C2X4_9CAUL|nr:hypothetical protein [Brevundimonas goettingensis]QTC90870.1 hypothetical protein IFJ75_16835 [Brevundimonas goettingensis]